MRIFIVAAILLVAACSAPQQASCGHPGEIGGEQAVKAAALGC